MFLLSVVVHDRLQLSGQVTRLIVVMFFYISFFVQPSGFDSEEITLHVFQKQSGVLDAPIAHRFDSQQRPPITLVMKIYC
jgi:hypothetical protein